MENHHNQRHMFFLLTAKDWPCLYTVNSYLWWPPGIGMIFTGSLDLQGVSRLPPQIPMAAISLDGSTDGPWASHGPHGPPGYNRLRTRYIWSYRMEVCTIWSKGLISCSICRRQVAALWEARWVKLPRNNYHMTGRINIHYPAMT